MSRRAAGLKAWLLQRLSALYLALFGAVLAVRWWLAPPTDHAALRAWIAPSWVMLGLLLCIPLLAAHAWVGARDVCMDYLRPAALRLAALTGIALLLTGAALWAWRALLLAGLRV